MKHRTVYAKFGDKSLFSGTLILSFGRSRISMTHAKLNAKKVPFETAHAGNSVDQLSTPTRKITPRSPHISSEPIRWRAGLALAVANSCLGGFRKKSHELCLLTVGYSGVCCVQGVKKSSENSYGLQQRNLFVYVYDLKASMEYWAGRNSKSFGEYCIVICKKKRKETR